MREVKLDRGVLSVFDEPAVGGDGFYSVRLFYRTATGWSPPLPPDIEVPSETRRSAPEARSLMRSEPPPVPRRAPWLLGEIEDWRL
jgi:hypothetical protein